MDTPIKYLAQTFFNVGFAFQIPMATGILRGLLNELKPYNFNLTVCLLLSLTGFCLIIIGYIIVKKEVIL